MTSLRLLRSIARTAALVVLVGGMVLAGATPLGAQAPSQEVNIEDVSCELKGPRRWCAIPFNGAVDHAKVRDLRCKVKVTATRAAVIEVRACGSNVVASKTGGSKGGATLTIPFTVKGVKMACDKPDGGETPLEVAPKGSPGVKVTVELKTLSGRPCE